MFVKKIKINSFKEHLEEYSSYPFTISQIEQFCLVNDFDYSVIKTDISKLKFIPVHVTWQNEKKIARLKHLTMSQPQGTLFETAINNNVKYSVFINPLKINLSM